MPQHTALEQQLAMLRSLSGNVGEKQDALQTLATKPIDHSFREKGQTGIEAFFNPSDEQRDIIGDISRRILSADPRQGDAAIFGKSITGGLDLAKSMREEKRADQIGVAKLGVQQAKGAFDRGADLFKLQADTQPAIPADFTIGNTRFDGVTKQPIARNVTPDKPAALQRVPVEYLDTDGLTVRKGFATFNPDPTAEAPFSDEVGKPLEAGSFRPIAAPGKTAFDIEGTAAGKPFTPEQAGKAAMVEASIASADALDALLFDTDEDGNIDFANPNRKNIAGMTLNPFSGGVPFSVGRTAHVRMRNMIEAKIRIESGAAVPETEVVRALDRFQPSLLDSNETILVKRQLLRDYFTTAKSLYDPLGNLTQEGKLFMNKGKEELKAAEERSPGVVQTKMLNGREAVRAENGKWYYASPLEEQQ